MKTLPAGEYFIGDCCAILQESPIETWEQLCRQFITGGEYIVLNGFEIVTYSTGHKVGTFASNLGYDFISLSGLIGCMPAELWQGKGTPEGCLPATFTTDFVCEEYSDGRLFFGGVVVDTACVISEKFYDEQ